MLNLDLYIAPKDNGWTIFAPTARGIYAMNRYLKNHAPTAHENGMMVLTVTEKEGLAFYRKVRRYLIEDTDMYYFPNVMLTHDEVAIAAGARAIKFQEEKLRTEASNYFVPKIDKAIAERDGKEVVRLIDALPSIMTVEKSFIVMRACKEFEVKALHDINARFPDVR